MPAPRAESDRVRPQGLLIVEGSLERVRINVRVSAL